MLGYSPKNPFIPPLQKTTQIISEFDRNFLLLRDGPNAIINFLYLLIQNYLNGPKNQEYFYGNALAYGNQVYPRGLNKYYDLYSKNGF